MAKYTLTGLRAIIHARESKWDKRAGNRSTSEQVDESRSWCETEGVQVARVIVEENTTAAAKDRSTRAKPRKRWEETKRLLAQGDEHGPIDILVTWSSTRGQRDLDEYVELRRLSVEAGVLWCYSGQVYDMTDGDDRFRTAIDSAVGERDIEVIRENVNRGLRANRANGRPHGPTPYGYRRVYNDSTGAFVRQEPDPEQAPVVRRIFDLWCAGHSALSIADALEADGITTSAGGGTWVSGTIYTILRNAAYAGRLTHHGEDIGPGCWPPIIGDDTWGRAALRLAERTTPWDRASPTKLLLTGLARCGVCDDRMTRQPPSAAGRQLGYVCRRSHTYRNTTRLDAWVTERLLRKIAEEELAGPVEDSAVIEARGRVGELNAELDAARALRRGEVPGKRLSVMAFAEIETDLLAQLEAAERLARRAPLPVDVDIPPPDKLAGWWVDDLTAGQRREVMASYVVAVTVRPVGRGNRGYDDADFTEIEWRR